jgi:transcriptional regulator
MYIPKSFRNNDIEQLHPFIEQFNFATLISEGAEGLQVTHIPLMLDRSQGQYGTLLGHFAMQNPHVNLLDQNKNSLCIFHGPHAYISPAWYKNSPSVPTWNYTVVHAHGKLQRISPEQLSEDLTRMVNESEAKLKERPNYLIPEDYKAKLLNHIVGFRMEINQIEGKFKLGQNRSVEDQAGILVGLKKENTRDSLALMEFMQSIGIKSGPVGSDGD